MIENQMGKRGKKGTEAPQPSLNPNLPVFESPPARRSPGLGNTAD